MDVRPPESEPKRLPGEAGIWVKMEPPGVAEVYEVVFKPEAPLRLIARRLAKDVIYDFAPVDRDFIGNWWRVP
jgi:hypothetical protein